MIMGILVEGSPSCHVDSHGHHQPLRSTADTASVSGRHINSISDRGARSAESAPGQVARAQTLEPDLGNASAGSSVILQPRHVHSAQRCARQRARGMACAFSWFTRTGRFTMATPTSTTRWRTVDIVVAAVIAVAFGVIFAGWNALWESWAGFAAFPPAKALLIGVWLIPAVLAPLIIRKPGAGVFAETVAADHLHVPRLAVGNDHHPVRPGPGRRRRGRRSRPRRTARSGCRPRSSAAPWRVRRPALIDIAVYYADWSLGWQLAQVAHLRGQWSGRGRPRLLAAGPGPGPDRRARPVPVRPGPRRGLSQ